MPLKEQFAELRAKFDAHVETEEKQLDIIAADLDRNQQCHLDIKDKLADTQRGIWWITAMILALLVFIPTISGLLVYIFQMHQHGQ